MTKERHFSADNDFRTGFFYKLSISVGIVLIIIYASLKIISTFIKGESTGWMKVLSDFSQSSKSEAIIAFAIILLALGVILYFFHYQFGKLAKIAEEIENSEEYEETE